MAPPPAGAGLGAWSKMALGNRDIGIAGTMVKDAKVS
jgi:hypothetical protein